VSETVFPALPGLKWGNTKTPVWDTKTQSSASGKEARAQFQAFPRWKIGLAYEFLRERPGFTELQSIVGFFNSRKGSFENFLYDDPNDRAVSNLTFAVAPGGSVVKFRLLKSFGGFLEPIGGLNGTPSIYKGGVLQSAATYSIDADGWITFNTAPAAASVLSWSGLFYHRVRFVRDEMEFSQFLKDLFEMKKVELITDKR
jgi:uncharacterized protein (TIGR02217 family)